MFYVYGLVERIRMLESWGFDKKTRVLHFRAWRN